MFKIRFSFCIFIAVSILIFLSALSIFFGAVPLSAKEIFGAIFDESSSAARILRYVRFPRAIAAILCGAALSVSGFLIQTSLQNPLGSPTVLGMNAGSALFVVIASAFFANPIFPPIFAFFGACFALLAVVSIGRKSSGLFQSNSILLSGVAMNAFLSALTDGINSLLPDTIYSRSAFRIGSLSSVQSEIVFFAGIFIAASIFLSLLISQSLDILLLGDETSLSLGLNASRTRLFALVLASILSGAGVSFAGLVGFVGLIVPHCVRLIFKGRSFHLIILSAIFGADLVLLCDFFSRFAFSPYEIPVGVPLSLLGGPFFIFLLLKRKNR